MGKRFRNKTTLKTESPINVIEIPVSTKKPHKLLHKYHQNCLKFGISLPTGSDSISFCVAFRNTGIILTHSENTMRNLSKFLKQNRRTFKHPKTNMLCNKDKNTKALWCFEITGER